MTWTITIGADIVYCVMRPSFATTWCLAMQWHGSTQDEPPLEEQCRACRREMAWHGRRVTRDLRRGAA